MMNKPIKYEDVELMYDASDVGKKFVQLCAMEEGYHARHKQEMIMYALKFLLEHPYFIPNKIYIE